MRRDLGDFQTPPGLVSAVLDRLDGLGIPHGRVLEPTCGRGHFLAALLARPGRPEEVRGFEIQGEHLAIARAIGAADAKVVLEEADFFAVDLRARLPWQAGGPLLVVGNPPWVTSAALGRLGATNGARGRVEGIAGLDARTGRSNFDLAEAVWHKLLNELPEADATIALLCKSATARNVLRWAVRTSRPIARASIHRIDARRWFAATVDACLFVVRLAPGATCDRADVYPSLEAGEPSATIGVVDDLLVADLGAFERHRAAFGRSSRAWRQGVKHDAASAMELTRVDAGWRNAAGEVVDVEPDRVYPLLKGTDLARPAPNPRRGVIVTQHRLGEDTRRLADRSPRLWAYLQGHAATFAARRSKVYAGRPPFAMFGVGDYAFARHKVAVSGLHKAPRFRAIGPVDGRPVLLDDTCYFLPCDSARESSRLASRLNGPAARSLLASLCFPDAKRPVTKAILQRIDLGRLPAPGRSLACPGGVE